MQQNGDRVTFYIAPLTVVSSTPIEFTVSSDVASNLASALRVGGARLTAPKALKRTPLKVPRTSDERQLAAKRLLLRALKTKDEYTFRHGVRVSLYASEIAKAMGLSPNEVNKVRNQALLHDIGKLGVPQSVLESAQVLSSLQLAKVRQHPTIGAEIIRAAPLLHLDASGVEGHHERLDGQGYPRRLESEQISLASRIIAVADTFDAMTSDRPYHHAISKKVAIKTLRKVSRPLHRSRRGNNRNMFDRRVVDTLSSLFPRSSTARAALRLARNNATHHKVQRRSGRPRNLR